MLPTYVYRQLDSNTMGEQITYSDREAYCSYGMTLFLIILHNV